MGVILKFLMPLVAVSSTLQGVFCSPIGGASDPILDTRQSGFFVVTGVTEGGNAPRLELRQLQANPTQYNLFNQALERVMLEGQTLKTSYYQIGGIHGRPWIPWDGVTGGGNTGYCPHGSNLFGPWHRPYLALLEQRVHDYAVTIANEFPAGSQRDTYRAAAATLRFPYWDWAASYNPVLPTAMSKVQVQVTRPNGQKVKISNPLFRYNFHPVSVQDFGNNQFGNWPKTLRAPDSTAPGASSQIPLVESSMQNNVPGLQQRIYRLFSNPPPTYNFFSSQGAGTTGDSLETVHGVIHNVVGQGGHMSPIDYSGFDPAFWLHHANVDRFLALWQALYPATYVTPFVQRGSTYTVAAGSTQGPDSPLTPFHRNTNGDFWTSNLCRETSSFHYTYPELQDNPSKDTLTARINTLYGPRVAGLAGSMSTKAKTVRDLDIAADQTVHQYAVTVAAPLNPLGGSYSVLLFLGEPESSDPAGWLTDANYVGQHGVFAPLTGTAEVLVPGRIPLTDALLSKFQDGDLPAVDIETVLAYLKKNLNWAILQDMERVPGSQVPGVDAQIVSTDLKAPTSPSEFPNYLGSTKQGPVEEL